ncbi:MAG: hypothetical protein JW875_05415 [Spirochaetales bacterium]|nr:hypothetical protein [Spirochaetales bacterium]HNQ97959.1 hypothetical protein [Treponemataceae bacterium]
MYELVKLFFLMRDGTGSGLQSLSWYAGAPLLVIPPVLFFLFTMDETSFAPWLRLASLIKVLSVPSFVAFIVAAVPLAREFGLTGGGQELTNMALAGIFALVDGAIALYCFGRGRILCT